MAIQMKAASAVLLLLVAWCLGFCSAAATEEPRTGISFPEKLGRRQLLSKLGVRTKGPFKVYAVGQYGDNAFLLQMSMSVKAQKISDALIDALKPRCRGSCKDSDVDEFEALLMSGLPNGASKGTKLLFETGRGKLAVTINDKPVGSIASKPLAKAFAGIYTDKDAVCQLKPVDLDDEDGAIAATKEHEKMESIVLAAGAIVVTTFLLWIYDKTSARKAVRVKELNVYPIKSCAPQQVQMATATARGFEGDRILQVTDKNNRYCTPREEDKARLFLVSPSLSLVDQNILTVTAPNMTAPLQMDLSIAPTERIMVEVLEAPEKLPLEDYGTDAAKWMERATNIAGCRLTGIGPGFGRTVQVNPAQGDEIPTMTDPNGGSSANQGTTTAPPVSLADEAPYLLCSTASLQDLNRRLNERGQEAVDMQRFRPNLVIQGLKPWEEDTLSKIRVGGQVEFYVWQRCGRCAMTTIDRNTLERGPEPLATLNTFRERQNGMRNFGMHLIPDERTILPDMAQISVGDYVEILEYDNDRRNEWERLFS